MGKGVSRTAKKIPTSFMDGPQLVGKMAALAKVELYF